MPKRDIRVLIFDPEAQYFGVSIDGTIKIVGIYWDEKQAWEMTPGLNPDDPEVQTQLELSPEEYEELSRACEAQYQEYCYAGD